MRHRQKVPIAEKERASGGASRYAKSHHVISANSSVAPVCTNQLHWTTQCQSVPMASVQSIPRFLLLRGSLLPRPRTGALPPFLLTATLRYASSSNPKTLSEQFRRRQTPVIPQPDKYRPPSHGNRTPRSETAQRSYGPPLTAEDKKRMRNKKYPNMMSPEGTFSHWFLNNKLIHVWICMVCQSTSWLAVG